MAGGFSMICWVDLLGLFTTIWGRRHHFDYSPEKKKRKKHTSPWLEDYFPLKGPLFNGHMSFQAWNIFQTV